MLRWSARAWFVTAAVGQIGFVTFILAFYGASTLMGDIASWNEKPLIDGYIEGDRAGNAMFGVHVLLAAVMTLSGLVQLTPQLRSWSPAFHRVSGRTYLLTACILAIGGLWLTWGRGTRLSLIGGYAITINALLILSFAGLTLSTAIGRRIASHRQWAMRLFMVANGVWFLRVFLMAWPVIAGGPVGMNRTMSGPVDVVFAFGCYLIPLSLYELYRLAGRHSSVRVKVAMSSVVAVATAVTAIGVFGAVTSMWLPYL